MAVLTLLCTVSFFFFFPTLFFLFSFSLATFPLRFPSCALMSALHMAFTLCMTQGIDCNPIMTCISRESPKIRILCPTSSIWKTENK